MDTRQYQYLIAIAEEKNLLSASERLFVTSSALSQALTKIEKEIGAVLFERTKTGFAPTLVGEVLIDMAYEVVRKEESTFKVIDDLLNKKTESYAVGVTHGRGTTMFSNIYKSFRKEYPNTQVSLRDGTGQEMAALLKRGKVDIAFFPAYFADDSFDTSLIAHETLMLAVPSDHYMASYWHGSEDFDFPSVNLSYFKNEEFLLMYEGSSVRKLTDWMCEQAGFKPKISFQASSMITIDNLSKNGYGIAFVHSSYATKDNPNVVYFHPIPSASSELCAAYSLSKSLTPSQRYLIELSKDYFSSFNLKN